MDEEDTQSAVDQVEGTTLPEPREVLNNVLIHNGTMYKVEEVASNLPDSLDVLAEYYKEQVGGIEERYRDAVARDSISDMDRQLERLTHYGRRDEVHVTSAKYGKALLVTGYKELVELRHLVYHPTKVKTDLSELAGVLDRGMRAVYNQLSELCTLPEFDTMMGNSTQRGVEITIDHDYYYPMQMYYSPRADQVYSLNLQVFHSTTRIPEPGSVRMCTGEMGARTYWENPGFYASMQCINQYSPYSNKIDATHLGRHSYQGPEVISYGPFIRSCKITGAVPINTNAPSTQSWRIGGDDE